MLELLLRENPNVLGNKMLRKIFESSKNKEINNLVEGGMNGELREKFWFECSAPSTVHSQSGHR
jgi:hypothetical protein